LTPRFRIEPTDRTLIVGHTGSGKTTLALELIRGYRSLVVIDPKWRVQVPGAGVISGSPRAFAQWWPQRIRRVIYRPDPRLRRHEDVDEVIGRVLAYGRTCLYVDEAMELASPGAILPAYKRAITQGRELYVPVVSASQRPVGIHNTILTEAEHCFAFKLTSSGDRDKLAAFYGDDAGAVILEPFAFLYAGTRTGGVVYRCPPLELGAGPRAAPEPTSEAAAQ